MVLEAQTPATKETPPENIYSSRQISQGTSEEEGHRKGEETNVPVSALYSSQERLRQMETDSRPLNYQQIHKLPIIQDAVPQRSKTITPSRLLDHINRHDRWLLARPNLSKQETLPRFPLQRHRLAVQSNAFWTKHRSKNIYQVDVTCRSGDGTGGHMVPTLPGRPTHRGSNKGEVPSSYSNSLTDSQQARLHCQRKEVTFNSSTGLPLARDRVGFDIAHSQGITRQDLQPSNITGHDPSVTNLHEESYNASAGLSQLHRTLRSSDSTYDGGYKDHTASVQTKITRCPNKDSGTSEIQTLQMVQPSNNSTTTRVTSPITHHTNRCQQPRLGFPGGPEEVSRIFRQVSKTVKQYTGTSHNLVRPHNSSYQRSGDSDFVRQYRSDSSSQTRQLSSFSSSISSRANMEKSKSLQMDPYSITHRRPIQYLGRPTLKKRNTIIRMVTTASNIQENPTARPTSRSRLVRHTSEQQTTNICSPMSRSKSSSNRRTINPLGEMAPPIPVSSNSSDFESSSKTQSHTLHQSYSYNTRVTNKAMVYGSSITESSFNPSQGSFDSDSGEQRSDSPSSFTDSRVDTIRKTYDTRFPNSPRLVSLLTSNLKKSTEGEYERKWHYFCLFLRERNLRRITLKRALKFFIYLFDEKGLKPTTIENYRSALAVPLKLRFNIDLHDPAVPNLLRAMSLERPASPPTAPAWCLNTVLTYIDELPRRKDAETTLRKSAFLLLLATGYRISELHACVRDAQFCLFRPDSSLSIRPHPSFLAKNECTDKRWPHKIIPPLFLGDGSSSHLCPVKSLQKYLRITSSTKTGSLFLHHKTGKPLSIKQLSTSVCKLILQADPTVKATVHDVRKFSAAFTLSETMQTENMIHTLHWRSPHTFWKYYMFTTPPLNRAVVLPGTSFPKGSAVASPHLS